MSAKGTAIRRSPAERAAYAVVLAVLFLLALICVYPLYQVLVCSVSDPGIVMRKNSMLLWPQGFQLEAYRMVLHNRNIASGFKNTLVYMSLGTALQYVVTVFTAYPVSLRGAKLKLPLMIFMSITMYFSGGLIPFYLLINQLGMMNTMWVLIIPNAVNVWNIIIMRTQFMSIPESLKEAAYIDGAGEMRILLQILLPLSKAVTAVLILFTAVGYWNMWFEPMIYLTDRVDYPIQSVLREILIDANEQTMNGAGQANVIMSQNNVDATKTLVKYANIIVCTLPILCVYPFAQKYFMKGVMIGSLKG